jgi:hypothetical protein
MQKNSEISETIAVLFFGLPSKKSQKMQKNSINAKIKKIIIKMLKNSKNLEYSI